MLQLRCRRIKSHKTVEMDEDPGSGVPCCTQIQQASIDEFAKTDEFQGGHITRTTNDMDRSHSMLII